MSFSDFGPKNIAHFDRKVAIVNGKPCLNCYFDSYPCINCSRNMRETKKIPETTTATWKILQRENDNFVRKVGLRFTDGKEEGIPCVNCYCYSYPCAGCKAQRVDDETTMTWEYFKENSIHRDETITPEDFWIQAHKELHVRSSKAFRTKLALTRVAETGEVYSDEEDLLEEDYRNKVWDDEHRCCHY